MTQQDRAIERERVLEMIEIEEKFGPVVSGGPSRGAVAPARETGPGLRRTAHSASQRARGRVRFLAHAVPAQQPRAA
ncbi:MAG: hypothetical protein ABJE95_19225 [Byssovorax sp.]